MKKNFLAVISIVLYKIIYECIYMYEISPLFGYMGLPYTPNKYKLIFSYVLLAIIIAMLPKHNAPISKYLISIFVMFTVVPLLAFYWQANASTTYILYCFLSYVVLVGVTCNPLRLKKDWKIVIDQKLIGRVDIVFILAMLVAVMLGMVTIKYGLPSLKALNLYNIYEVRGSRSFSGIYGYIINWLPYALVPCLLCTALYMKKWGYVIFAIVTQLYMYLLVGSKTALFSIGLILASYLLVKLKINYIFGWCFVIVTLCCGCLVIWKVFGELMPFGIFPVRLLSVPSSISFEHYEFFSANPKLYFSENFIGKILGIESPYDQISTYLVANGKSNHCTGYLGDAYDNGGLIVMLLYSVVLALIFRLIDSLYISISKKEDILPVFVGILTYSMIYMNDGTLTAVLVTGGLLIILAILKIQEIKVHASR